MAIMQGIDGPVNVEYPESTDCCPPDICTISLEQLACTFVNLLPSGPMWDRQKCEFQADGDSSQTSMVAVAQFIAAILHDALKSFLWPALREAYPWTATSTLDDWLEKLNWSDCYGACRNPSLTVLSPFEIMGECGPVYCGPTYEPDFQRAYNHALVQALSRFALRPLGTLGSLNSILEPLGVRADPGNALLADPLEDVCESRAESICITLSIFRQTIKLPRLDCSGSDVWIPSYVSMGCDRPLGIPETVWPTVMAAECISRAFLPKGKLCVVQLNCINPNEG